MFTVDNSIATNPCEIPQISTEEIFSETDNQTRYVYTPLKLPNPTEIEIVLIEREDQRQAQSLKNKELCAAREETVRTIGKWVIGIGTVATIGFAAATTTIGICVAAGAIASNPVGWAVGGTLGALALLAATGVGVAAIVVLATKGRFWNDVLKPVLIGVAVAATLVLAALIAFGVVAYIAAASKSKGGANLSHFRNGFGRFPGWSPYPRPVPILEAVVIGLMIQNVLKKEPICIPKSRKKSFEKEMETKEEVMPVFDEQINILEEKDLDYLQSGFLEFSTGMVSENPELFKGKFTGFNTPDTAYNESLESIRGQNYHSGVMKTLKVIRDNGRWPGIETDIAKIAMLDKSTPVKERLAVQLAAMKVNPDPLLALNFAKCLHALNKKEQAIKVLAYQGLIVEKAKDQVADIRTAKAHQHFNQLSALWLKEIGY